MKRILYIAIVGMVALSGCSKTYELTYDNFSLYPLLSGRIDSQELLDCRVTITTTSEFNKEAYDTFAQSLWQAQYEAADWTPPGHNGSFHAEIKKGEIVVYDSSNTPKLEVSVNDNKITSVSLYEKGEIFMELTGVIGCEWIDGSPRYTHFGGHLKRYEEGHLKEESISDYTIGCASYTLTNNIYYDSGALKLSEKFTIAQDDWMPDCYGEQELVSKAYFNEDGTIMTPAERIFLDNPEYVVLKSDLDVHKRSHHGTNYLILFPSEYDTTTGKGISVYSSNNLMRFTASDWFNFDIEESTLSLSNFHEFIYSGTTLSKNATLSKAIYRIEDGRNSEIEIVGNHYFWRSHGQPVKTSMQIYNEPIHPEIEEFFRELVNAPFSPWN